ncbi:hypothetical protein [Phascolarctobacterium succinatutens]|uniref:hypothetical protein n=1 Tax=Phascolarctobacterium succinatutens TaxID=626940 RepID=UPI0026F19427|nr:hypothetical protein [Phascolarctobacterium succinatutens]
MADDKKLHMLCGFCITVAVSSYSLKLGLILGLAAGAVKEAYDYCSYGVFDRMDMLATWAGAVCGAALTWAIIQI